MDIAVEMTRASVALATQRLKDNMIRIAEENWLPEHVRMLRALIVAADTDMDYQHAYEMANERVDGPELPTKQHNDARWIQVKYHVMTEEERKAGGFSNEIVYYLDCKMPDDGQEILVTNGKYVWFDTCFEEDGYSLDSGNDWIDITAWMPMPETYRKRETE